VPADIRRMAAAEVDDISEAQPQVWRYLSADATVKGS
jgi:hypothetical protein